MNQKTLSELCSADPVAKTRESLRDHLENSIKEKVHPVGTVRVGTEDAVSKSFIPLIQDVTVMSQGITLSTTSSSEAP